MLQIINQWIRRMTLLHSHR